MAKKTSAQNILMWILMIILVASLGGFGIDSFLGSRVTSIGAVGGREISTQDYARALQAEMNAYTQQLGQPVPLSLAQQFGLDRQVRAQLVTQAALENEADRLGIRYLRGAGEAGPGPRWRAFMLALREQVATPEASVEACAGACDAFDRILALAFGPDAVR